MDKDILKVPKIQRAVQLWVHPEGRVSGSIFLREQSPNQAGSETPQEMLNQGQPFLVFQRTTPDELVFYNLRSVIRVEYEDDGSEDSSETTEIQCRLQMMDGSDLQGVIRESLAPDRSRLLDYLNREGESFIKLHMDTGLIYLINKSYIINVHVAEAE